MTKSLWDFFQTRRARQIATPNHQVGRRKEASQFSSRLGVLALRLRNPNGIPALSPAVARHELPWVIVQSRNHQPQRGCTAVSCAGIQPISGLIQFVFAYPASPSFVVATLG